MVPACFLVMDQGGETTMGEPASKGRAKGKRSTGKGSRATKRAKAQKGPHLPSEGGRKELSNAKAGAGAPHASLDLVVEGVDSEKIKKPLTGPGSGTGSGQLGRVNGPGTGQRPFVPTDEQREQVLLMTGYGMTQEEMSTVIFNEDTGRGINKETLAKHFRVELDCGMAVGKVKVVGSLMKKAASDTHPQAVTAAIWITKTQYGWRGESKVTHGLDANSGVLVAPGGVMPGVWLAGVEESNKGKLPPGESVELLEGSSGEELEGEGLVDGGHE